jgi:hypothetical protein
VEVIINDFPPGNPHVELKVSTRTKFERIPDLQANTETEAEPAGAAAGGAENAAAAGGAEDAAAADGALEHSEVSVMV